MADDKAPTLDDRRTKATFDLFKELGCFRGGGGDGVLTIDDVGRLDVEKMMARALDCVAAVCEAQRVRVALKQPLKLREDGEALTPEQQAARNKVFRAALRLTAKGLTHDGAERYYPGLSMEHLLRAFPDGNKLMDGRGWLSMHWAVVADEDEESDVTEADVKNMYESDPMALRKHHLLADVADAESDCGFFGCTPAHMLCGLKMSEKNMSLVRRLSVSDPRAFTAKVVDKATVEHRYSALHVACKNSGRTEALLRLLVQLDPSQMKAFTTLGGPLGLLCFYKGTIDERQFQCLLEADSSVEVVHDAIRSCFFDNRVQTVAKLLEVNPAAALHKGRFGYNLAHACMIGDRTATADCIEFLKLLLARHENALKEADNFGRLPAHHAAKNYPVSVLDFVLGEYPEAGAAIDDRLQNLLHIAAVEGPEEHRAAKARLLCARYPAMMVQRDRSGCTPLLLSCGGGHAAMAQLLCEAGGREAASTAVLHPTDDQHPLNGRLPLHQLVETDAPTLTAEPLSGAADAFRLLLRVYPEAAGIEGGLRAYKKTPYCLAVYKGLPVYYRRLLLRAAPHLDPAELRRLNWAERRGAMFVAFAAVAKTPPLLAWLRAGNKDLVKHVVSFL